MARLEMEGASLRYIEGGAGEPVVFVLAEGYRAIAYSRRYHWPNRPIADGADYAMAQLSRIWARCCALRLEAVGAGKSMFSASLHDANPPYTWHSMSGS